MYNLTHKNTLSLEVNGKLSNLQSSEALNLIKRWSHRKIKTLLVDSEEILDRVAHKNQDTTFLKKPFTPQELHAALSKVFR